MHDAPHAPDTRQDTAWSFAGQHAPHITQDGVSEPGQPNQPPNRDGRQTSNGVGHINHPPTSEIQPSFQSTSFLHHHQDATRGSSIQDLLGLAQACEGSDYQAEFFLDLWGRQEPDFANPVAALPSGMREPSANENPLDIPLYESTVTDAEADDAAHEAARLAQQQLHNDHASSEDPVERLPPQNSTSTMDVQIAMYQAPQRSPDRENSVPSHAMRPEQFDAASYGMPQDLIGLTPDMLSFTSSLDNPITPQSLIPSSQKQRPSRILFSGQQLKQIQKLWHGQRSYPSMTLMSVLWDTVVKHPQSNIFSVAQTVEPENQYTESTSGRWNLTERCRKDLMELCGEIEILTNGMDDPEIPFQDAASVSPSSVSDTSSLPGLAVDGFPSLETLEASLDFFFQHCPFAFVHGATFDARHTHRSILLPMCLIGLSSLYAERSHGFISKYLKNLIRISEAGLAAKDIEECRPWSFLVTITSTLLVAYLALGFLEECGHSQAHMLCSKMLRLAEKQNLFAANLGGDLTEYLRLFPVGEEQHWKAWARAESIKRVFIYLLLLDSAYTRVQGTTGASHTENVELLLPCDDALFRAPNLLRFNQARERSPQLSMPALSFADFENTAPKFVDKLSLELIVTVFILRVAAARQRVPKTIGGEVVPALCLAQACAKEERTVQILRSAMVLPSLYPRELKTEDRMSALAWNNLGLFLTADMDLLENASGKQGLEVAQTAMESVAIWARSASARRSVLHAAQIFGILSATRLRHSNIVRPDVLLFTSALIITMYLFVMDSETQNSDPNTLELLDEVDWVKLGDEGVLTQQGDSPPPEPNHEPLHAALQFIRHGGVVSFAGEKLFGGRSTARKILTNYVHLMDELGKWRRSRYTQLLRTMSDFSIEGSGISS